MKDEFWGKNRKNTFLAKHKKQAKNENRQTEINKKEDEHKTKKNRVNVTWGIPMLTSGKRLILLIFVIKLSNYC